MFLYLRRKQEDAKYKSRKSAHHAEIVNTMLKFLLLFEEIKQGSLNICHLALLFSRFLFLKGAIIMTFKKYFNAHVNNMVFVFTCNLYLLSCG